MTADVDCIPQLNSLALSRQHRSHEYATIIRLYGSNAAKHLAERAGNVCKIFAADQLQQISVTEKVQPRCRGTLSFQELSKSFLNLCQQIGLPFKGPQDARNSNDVEDKWRFAYPTHDCDELRFHTREATALGGQDSSNLVAAVEDSSEVDVSSLSVGVDFEDLRHTLETLGQTSCFFLKGLVMRGHTYLPQR